MPLVDGDAEVLEAIRILPRLCGAEDELKAEAKALARHHDGRDRGTASDEACCS